MSAFEKQTRFILIFILILVTFTCFEINTNKKEITELITIIKHNKEIITEYQYRVIELEMIIKQNEGETDDTASKG